MKYLSNAGLTKLVELINEKFATKTELSGKANSTHTHDYAGSATPGGAATSANKINTDAGSQTQPVYFNNGVPVATKYALNKTVPANALFTDTTYENATTSAAGLMSADDKTKLNGIATNANNYTHPDTVTAGTVGTSSATSGVTLAVPYVTYNANGHITATGTHTHTVSGFLTDHQTIKQDAITGATCNRFGTCGTAAATAAKTVLITAGTPTLTAGLRVSVKFTYANTADSPTLNVNSLGAKNIFHMGTQITTDDNKALLAGTCDFVYDGTQFHLVGNYIDNEPLTNAEIEEAWLDCFYPLVTVTITQSDHQTIHVLIDDETDHTETFTVRAGAQYDITVIPDTGYTAGTVTNASGTISEDMDISATEATLQ